MKKQYLILLAVLLSITIYSCKQHSDKKQEDNTQQFADLGKDKDFRDTHQEPGDYKIQDGTGKMIKYAVAVGDSANAYFIPGNGKSDQFIFVFHEWYGLNDYVKRESEKLSKTFPSANILALDLYDGNVATTREEASKYMQTVKEDRAHAIIQGALNFAGKQAQIATIGWCFGGGWSLQAAMQAGPNADACVMYYGMPVNDPQKLQSLNAPVLGIFANKDKWITPAKVDTFKKAMNKAGKSIEIHQYDANHAFANPSNQIFDSTATADAWKHTKTFLKAHLR